jgi:CRISPR-associated protein Cmr3
VTTMLQFVLRPLDTLFFRDGRPFNQEDEGMADARSVFPPFPPVMAGAFRAAVAREQGWDEGRSWAGVRAKDGPVTIDAVLGDGPDDTGRLRFSPPLVLREMTGDHFEPLFPVPRHLLGKELGWTFRWLRPSRDGFDTDLGRAVRLPTLAEGAPRGLKPIETHLLTASGLEAVLHGRPPPDDALVAVDAVWRKEPRVGLERDPVLHSARHGMLYAATHIRLGRGATLGVEVEGLPDGWRPQPLAPLGGFQRLVEIEKGHWDMPRSLGWAELGARDDTIEYLVVLTAPANLPKKQGRTPGAVIEGLPGKVVAACLDRPVWIGGWSDGFGKAERGPQEQRPYLRAGSTWFMRASAAEVEPASIDGFPPRAIGTKQNLGFGACLIGRWPQGEDER